MRERDPYFSRRAVLDHRAISRLAERQGEKLRDFSKKIIWQKSLLIWSRSAASIFQDFLMRCLCI